MFEYHISRHFEEISSVYLVYTVDFTSLYFPLYLIQYLTILIEHLVFVLMG